MAIDFQEFQCQSVQAGQAALNDWLTSNPGVRIINVETIQNAIGGGSSYATEVRLVLKGIRAWFERAK